MGYIYKIVFTNTTKAYIGQTTQELSTRFNKHIALLKGGRHHSKKLQKDWEYLTDPSIIMLEECSNIDLNDREIYWIKKYDSYYSGYNATEGGGNTGVGHMHCAAKLGKEDYSCILYCLAYTIWQLEEIAIELEVPKTIVESISGGYSHTNLAEEYPEAYSLAMSKNRKGMYQVTRRPDVISPSGEIHQVYNVDQFEKEHNLCYGGLRSVILGKRKTHKGWRLAC